MLLKHRVASLFSTSAETESDKLRRHYSVDEFMGLDSLLSFHHYSEIVTSSDEA